MSGGTKILFGSLTAAVVAVAVFITISINDLLRVCYELTEYKLKSIDDKYVYIDLKLRVKNPAKLNITIKGYYIDVFINNKWVANTQNKDKKVIHGGTTDFIEMASAVNHQKTWAVFQSQSILDLLSSANTKNVSVELRGKFHGSVLGYSINVPIKIKTSLKEIEESAKKPSAC